jgi:NAD(P)-dependent dehydrogenase (short-subunit alcohol dehydrogenase family)
MGWLDGKVAIVTGAGGGIGREHALALASEGASVLVNDLGGSRDGTGKGQNMADAVVDEIRAAGGEAAANYDDVSTVPGGKNILQGALDAFERVDILVNNAGILRDKSFANTSEDMWDIVVKVHLKGTYCVTHAVYNHMKSAASGGVIINTSSTSGLNGNFGQCNYGAAKAGIAGFSRCLAIEGVKYGIRVHILAPVALTRLTDDLPVFDQADEAVKAKMDPAQVSPLIVYLASDQAKDITGKTFYVGGGRIAEMKVVTHTGKTKDSGLWTPQEIADQMKPGEILLPE